MTVRSTQLGANDAVDTSEVTLYTVPSGKRTILKFTVCSNNASTATDVTLRIKAGGSQVMYWKVALGVASGSSRSVLSSVWIVLNAGQALTAQSSQASAAVLASGAELTLPA